MKFDEIDYGILDNIGRLAFFMDRIRKYKKTFEFLLIQKILGKINIKPINTLSMLTRNLNYAGCTLFIFII